jgi:hypothetical protein
MVLTKAGKQHKLANLLKEPGVQEYAVYLEARVMADSIETAIKLGEQLNIGYGIAHVITPIHVHVHMGRKRLATAKYPELLPF